MLIPEMIVFSKKNYIMTSYLLQDTCISILFYESRLMVALKPTSKEINQHFEKGFFDVNMLKARKKVLLFILLQVVGYDRLIVDLTLRIASPSSVFVRFNPQRLFHICRPQKDVPVKRDLATLDIAIDMLGNR